MRQSILQLWGSPTMTKLNWQTASDKEKIEWLIRYVFKLPIREFDASLREAYAYYYAGEELHVECWNICGIREKDGEFYDEVFNPLYSIEDAWSIVEAMSQPPRTLEQAKQQAYAKFALWWEKANLWACSRQEACDEICKASLSVLGLLEA